MAQEQEFSKTFDTGLEFYNEGVSNTNYVVVPTVKVINSVNEKLGIDIEKYRQLRGQFIHTETREISTSLKVVPLTLRKMCSLSEGEFPNNIIVCRSFDFFVPSTVPSKAPMCRELQSGPRGRQIVPVCEYAQWKSGPDNKRLAPKCKEASVLVFYDLTSNTVFQIIVGGMNLRKESGYMAFINHVRSAGKDLYCFSATISTVPGETVFPKSLNSDKARPLVFSDITYLPEWKKYAEMAETLTKASVVDPSEHREIQESGGTIATDDDADGVPF